MKMVAQTKQDSRRRKNEKIETRSTSAQQTLSSKNNNGRSSPKSVVVQRSPSATSFEEDYEEEEDEEEEEKKLERTRKNRISDNERHDEKMEPAQIAKTFERQWVKIGDAEYDVSEMKHPGGSVIYYMLAQTGADATEAFREFHYRSKRAEKYLKTLPSRKFDQENHLGREGAVNEHARAIDTKDRAMLKDFAAFREELERDGYFEPSIAHVSYRMFELCVTFAISTYLMFNRYSILSVISYGAFFGARCGWVQHEGGHNSLTGNIWIDKRIQAMLMGFGLGTSGDMWNLMHNKHHATPQKIRHDMDLDTTPAVAFFKTAVEENRDRGFSKFWARFQAWTFVPITSGVFVMAFWLYILHPLKVFKKKNFEEAFWMLSSHVVRTLVIKAVRPELSYVHCYALYALSQWVAGMYLFAHFSTSHTHTKVVEFNDHPSWVRYAVEHTVDIAPDQFYVNWLMGYLNCQVIHHLFPDMPQFRQPEVSKKFESFAHKWGLEYTVLSYYEAWKATFKNLNDVGIHYYENGKNVIHMDQSKVA